MRSASKECSDDRQRKIGARVQKVSPKRARFNQHPSAQATKKTIGRNFVNGQQFQNERINKINVINSY